MKKSTKKVVIIICCVLAVVLIAGGTVVGVNVYNKNMKEQQIEQILSDIKGKYDTFVNESDRDKRIIIIKNLENDLTDYLKNNEPVEKIKEEYQSDLEQMKSYFVTYYEKVISDNTLNEVEKITDKTKLKACKDKLTTLLDKLNSEKDAVLSSEKFESLIHLACQLVASHICSFVEKHKWLNNSCGYALAMWRRIVFDEHNLLLLNSFIEHFGITRNLLSRFIINKGR